MEKLDFKKRDKAFYVGKQGRWDRLIIPAMTYVSITGMGDPGGPQFSRAVSALYPLAYGVKALFKARGADFTVPPLEAQWWADDPSVFVAGDRSAWQWRAMIRLPDDVTESDLNSARDVVLAKLARKKDVATDASTVNAALLEVQEDGDSLQTLHIGPYSDEAPVLAHLHDTVMPGIGVTFGGHHREIYLGDPRRAAPDKLRTLLRQPVQPAKTTG